MQTAGHWLLVGPKKKADELDLKPPKLSRDLDTTLLTGIKQTKPLEVSALVNDPEIGGLIDEMINTATEVFLITEFEKNDNYTVTQTELAKQWKTTLLASAIASGLRKTAAYLYKNQENFNPKLSLSDVAEVLLHCFPQDRKRPVNAALEIFKANGVTLESVSRLFNETKTYLFGQALVQQVQKAIEDGIRKEETEDNEDDVPLSQLLKKPPTNEPKLPLRLAVDMSTLPKGDPVPGQVAYRDYFYKHQYDPIAGEHYDNWVVGAFFGPSIVAVYKTRLPQKSDVTDVVFLLYRGGVWHRLVQVNPGARLYDFDQLSLQANLLHTFSEIWKWSGKYAASSIGKTGGRLSPGQTVVLRPIFRSPPAAPKVPKQKPVSVLDPDFGYDPTQVDQLIDRAPQIPYKVKVGDYFWYKRGDLPEQKTPQNIAKNLRVVRVIRDWLVVLNDEKGNKRNIFIQHENYPGMEGKMWVPLFLPPETGVLSSRFPPSDPDKYMLFYYSGDKPGVFMESVEDGSDDNDY